MIQSQFRTVSLYPIILWVPWWALWLSELDILETCSSGGSLKGWVAKYRVQTFTPHGKAGSWVFSPDSMLLCLRWDLLWKCVSVFSTHFHMGIFLFHLMCRSDSASFYISFKGNCSVYTCTFVVSMGGGRVKKPAMPPSWIRSTNLMLVTIRKTQLKSCYKE